MHIDEYGERLISASSNLGRIVAGDHIVVRGTHVEEEIQVTINGKVVE